MRDRAKESPTPHQLGGSGGNRAGETDHHHLMGADGLRRLARYGTAKAATLRACDEVGHAAMAKEGIRVNAITHCGDWVAFRHFPALAESRLQAANFCCVHLICGFCAIRRGARMMSRYLDRFRIVRDRQPELRPFLVTFTIKNGLDLLERLLHLERSLTRLHKRRHGKRSRSLMTEISGAVWSYEVTYSPENGWHPHVHAVWLAAVEPDMHALRDEWKEITEDSFMVDVRPIEADAKAPADVDPHAKGFAEVFKYAMKAAELPAQRLLDAYRVLNRRRLVRSFGQFYGVKEPAPGDLSDEMPSDGELHYIDLLWRYSGANGYVPSHVVRPPAIAAC
jgi:hypothetical protein